MHRSLLRRLILPVLAAVVAALGLATPVSAHNSLVSSDPADGASFDIAPTQITFVFDKSVPLDTMTAQFIDPSGARSELTGLAHGPNGDTDVVASLPTMVAGESTIRWKLVGPDGHPVTGRIEITITTTPPTTTPPTTTPPITTPAVVTQPVAGPATGVVLPTTTTSISTPTSAPSAVAGSVEVGRVDGDDFSTPGLVRWLLRYGSYLAIMTAVGIVVGGVLVWDGAARHRLLGRVLSRSLAVVAVLGFLHLLVLASDISGKAPWASFGSIANGLTTDAGLAFLARIALAATAWLVVFRAEIGARDVYWTAIGYVGIGLLGTWAFAGHARSQRWPLIGVTVDVVHHAAAAVWIGSLAIVGLVAVRAVQADQLAGIVQRLSRVAMIAVSVIVVSGLVQSVRLVGNPADLFAATHGTYLAVKIVILVVMLALADVNRRRVKTVLARPEHADGPAFAAFRKVVIAEFAIGLVVLAVTSAMVVSPPAVRDAVRVTSVGFGPGLYYTM